MNFTRLKIPTLVLAVVALVVGVSGGAVGAKLITGADIKDESIKSADIKNGTLVTSDLKSGGVNGNRLQGNTTPGNKLQKGSVTGDRLKDAGVTSAKIKDGTIGANDLSQAAKDSLQPSYGETNWSVVDRNVQGSGDSYLRAGPSFGLPTNVKGPPLGVGSLGIRTGSDVDALGNTPDKAAFGNQADFVGQPFSGLTAVSYSIFATGEDLSASLSNTPSISFEVSFTGLDFHTIFYQPSLRAVDANRWTFKDAAADPDPHWGISGVPGTTCDQNGALCTFDQVQDFLAQNAPDAAILTVQITKGSGQPPFSGAVDALKLNADVFDFEPFGVIKTVAPAPKR